MKNNSFIKIVKIVCKIKSQGFSKTQDAEGLGNLTLPKQNLEFKK